jgi:murein DD-endopeptidase MepM/ murein hydrolase activator NlpD
MYRGTGRATNRTKVQRLLGASAVALIAGGLVLGLAWRERRALSYLLRAAWRQRTLPDEQQDVPVERCPGAPWLLPTSGVLGVLWDDTRVPPYGADYRHSGLDIFGEGRENTVPVYAVADGLLTRLPGWKSAVIIQHEDPLRPGEVVWTYYAHMAGSSGRSYIVEDFSAGSSGVRVEAGQLLGYQGVWSGHPLSPGWLHLHFSVVKAAEDGSFLNETLVANTLDPSPYLGIVGNAASGQANWQLIKCQGNGP